MSSSLYSIEKANSDGSIFFQEALSILKGGEYHIGAYCRTAFALAKAHRAASDHREAKIVETNAMRERGNIPEEQRSGLGTNPEEYDKFVHFAYR